MFAQLTLMILHGFYVALALLLSLIGTSALVEFIIVLLRGEHHPKFRSTFEPEDA